MYFEAKVIKFFFVFDHSTDSFPPAYSGRLSDSLVRSSCHSGESESLPLVKERTSLRPENGLEYNCVVLNIDVHSVVCVRVALDVRLCAGHERGGVYFEILALLQRPDPAVEPLSPRVLVAAPGRREVVLLNDLSH